MQTALWYCPDCDKSTGNYRRCQKCGRLAVWQRFQLWPIASTEADQFYKKQEAEKHAQEPLYKKRNPVKLRDTEIVSKLEGVESAYHIRLIYTEATGDTEPDVTKIDIWLESFIEKQAKKGITVNIPEY